MYNYSKIFIIHYRIKYGLEENSLMDLVKQNMLNPGLVHLLQSYLLDSVKVLRDGGDLVLVFNPSGEEAILPEKCFLDNPQLFGHILLALVKIDFPDRGDQAERYKQ